MSICNKDCFHCPHPDCINDEMEYSDYQEAARRNKALLQAEVQKKKAAYQRAYREANREKARKDR